MSKAVTSSAARRVVEHSSLDELPAQFEAFIDRARAVLDRHIGEARKAVAAADAEKSSVQNALFNFQAQRQEAEGQLELSRREAGRMAGLVSIGHDIERARAELARLKTEAAKEGKALEVLAKQRTEGEAQVNALRSEAQRLIAIRTESEGVMANLRAQLRSVQIGIRP